MGILIDKLLEKGIIDKKKSVVLDAEVKNLAKKEEEVILQDDIISEKDLFKIKSELLNIPLRETVDIEGLGSILPDILKLIPEDSAKYYKMVPMGKKGNLIEIGMVYPEDSKVQEVLSFVSRRNNFAYKIFLVPISLFEKIIKRYDALKKEMGAAFGALKEREIREAKEFEEISKKINLEDFEKMADDAPIVRVVSVILRNATEGRASDIHIEPGKEKTKVRFRVDGALYSSLILPIKIHEAVVARIKIMSNLKIEERRIPQDGRFVYEFDGKNIDFRVSTLPTNFGEKVVMRALTSEREIKSIEDLGFFGVNETTIKEALKKPTGMLLATGPTGSGKTTTLYVLLGLLNTKEVNIITLEDPIEYFIEGISQSQIKPEIGYTFARGLRHILRQDPDIIMVGEIRDEETAELAVHAALTGHLVLSTLHTNDAVGVIPRLIDMGIKPFLITPSLNSAIGQRLIRKLCDKCKILYEPEEGIKILIKETLNGLSKIALSGVNLSSIKLYNSKGCSACGLSGFSGRIGIYEMVSVTDNLSEVVLKDPTEAKIRNEAIRQGMINMRQDGFIKSLKGMTTIEEVIRVTKEIKK